MKTVDKVKPTRPDPATLGGADRVYRVHRMSRRQRCGAGEIQGGQVPTFSRGLGEEAQATPRRPSYCGRDEGRDSEADGSFAGEVEGVGFRLQTAAVKAVW